MNSIADLDRFSNPFPSELSCYQSDDSNIHEVERVEVCKGCGHQMDLDEEDYVESDIWADEYIHNLDSCLAKYYKKEKESDSKWQNESLSA